MSTITLTATQHAILTHALEHTGGRIEWFPDKIKGGARKKVLEGLQSRALIIAAGSDWVVADAGYEALGRTKPVPAATDPTPDPEATPGADVATLAPDRDAPKAQPRTREHSKQAEVIRMLRRPEGATVRQICEATGWQSHTVRGAFAGALKKKLGLALVSEKTPGTDRVYRISA